jgi:hypothetical protein
MIQHGFLLYQVESILYCSRMWPSVAVCGRLWPFVAFVAFMAFVPFVALCGTLWPFVSS